jgi:hypothetical protein
MALTLFAVRRKDLAFRRVFWLFVIFILACASTHFMSIWTIWHPDYGAEGAIKAITAVVSILTAIQLWPLLPQALALPSPAALRDANEQLRQQVRPRRCGVRQSSASAPKRCCVTLRRWRPSASSPAASPTISTTC